MCFRILWCLSVEVWTSLAQWWWCRYYRCQSSVLLSRSLFRWGRGPSLTPGVVYVVRAQWIGRCYTEWWHPCKFWQPIRNAWETVREFENAVWSSEGFTLRVSLNSTCLSAFLLPTPLPTRRININFASIQVFFIKPSLWIQRTCIVFIVKQELSVCQCVLNAIVNFLVDLDRGENRNKKGYRSCKAPLVQREALWENGIILIYVELWLIGTPIPDH